MDQENNLRQRRQRYFKCYHDGNCFGRFTGRIPKQAANKAFTALLKDLKRNGIDYEYGQNVRFSIIETTRCSDKKSFTYNGKRDKLECPVQVRIGHGGYDKIINYGHKNYIKRCAEYDLDH